MAVDTADWATCSSWLAAVMLSVFAHSTKYVSWVSVMGNRCTMLDLLARPASFVRPAPRTF